MSRKSSDAAVGVKQLDLFGASGSPHDPKQAQRSAEAGGARPAQQQRTCTPDSGVKARHDQKLIDFVLGADRRPGRPTKALTSVFDKGAADKRQEDRPHAERAVDEKRLLDVREAAARLGLSKSTLDKMRCTGRGPRFIRATGRAVRYDPADLAAFAEDRRRMSTSEDAARALRG